MIIAIMISIAAPSTYVTSGGLPIPLVPDRGQPGSFDSSFDESFKVFRSP